MFCARQIGTHLGPKAYPKTVVERKLLLLADSQILNTDITKGCDLTAIEYCSVVSSIAA